MSKQQQKRHYFPPAVITDFHECSCWQIFFFFYSQRATLTVASVKCSSPLEAPVRDYKSRRLKSELIRRRHETSCKDFLLIRLLLLFLGKNYIVFCFFYVCERKYKYVNPKSRYRNLYQLREVFLSRVVKLESLASVYRHVTLVPCLFKLELTC